ncbi:MAG: hypothetical protein E6F96_09905 [Actinobacteria bacterium]|nr:MAG: hypothetical protein E6F96_09905 [Actinomycetota bacterium]
MAVHPRTRRPPARAAARAALRNDVVIAGIALLAAYDLALAVFMAAWPHAFYVHVGPFGLRNDHYIRDTATFNAAVGVGLALALRRPSWRVPMLAITTLQFALHSINHLVDIDKAYPAWNGYFDFFSLAVATIAIAGLLRVARGDAEAGAGRSWKGANR